MGARIETLFGKDESGNTYTILPRTSTKAVIDESGNTASELITHLSQEVSELKKNGGYEIHSTIETLSGDVETLSGNVMTLSGNVEALSGNVETLTDKIEENAANISGATTAASEALTAAHEAQSAATSAATAASNAQSTADDAKDKNIEQDNRINSIAEIISGGVQTLTDIDWSGHNMNEFVNLGEYYIHGNRTSESDNLPIINVGEKHTINARLTVLNSSLNSNPNDKANICVTQILRLSNRKGGDGHVYVRTGQGANTEEFTWGTWEKLMGIFEKNNVLNIEDIDSYTTNGMYSGIYASESGEYGGIQFFHLDTFLIITINGYAVSKLATPQITQLLYKLPAKAKPLEGERYAEIYIRTGFLDANGWSWGPFLKTVTNMDLYSQVTTLNANINTISGKANAAETAATEAKKDANSAKVAVENEATARTEADTELQSQINGKQDNIGSFSADEKNALLVSLGLDKTGVISQVQTWTQAADKGYDYVMSGLVRGVIPQANIDLFTSAGAIFNEESGYFELNGLTDISYEEMIKIYNAYNPNPWNGQQGMLDVKNTRTFLPANNDIIFIMIIDGIRLCYILEDIETINMFNTTKKIKFSNLQLSWFFNFKLKNIQNLIDCSRVTNYTQTFEKCYSLVDVRLWKIIASLSFKDCARLSNSSILYMINNEAATSPITITLHADVYNRCMANEDILAALEAHTNISLASA